MATSVVVFDAAHRNDGTLSRPIFYPRNLRLFENQILRFEVKVPRFYNITEANNQINVNGTLFRLPVGYYGTTAALCAAIQAMVIAGPPAFATYTCTHSALTDLVTVADTALNPMTQTGSLSIFLGFDNPIALAGASTYTANVSCRLTPDYLQLECPELASSTSVAVLPHVGSLNRDVLEVVWLTTAPTAGSNTMIARPLENYPRLIRDTFAHKLSFFLFDEWGNVPTFTLPFVVKMYIFGSEEAKTKVI